MIDIDTAVVAIYLAVVLGVGLWAGRHQHSLDEYAVVGRSFGPFVIFATMSASFIGGGFSALLTSARLREQGVKSIRIVERGADVGGLSVVGAF